MRDYYVFKVGLERTTEHHLCEISFSPDDLKVITDALWNDGFWYLVDHPNDQVQITLIVILDKENTKRKLKELLATIPEYRGE